MKAPNMKTISTALFPGALRTLWGGLCALLLLVGGLGCDAKGKRGSGEAGDPAARERAVQEEVERRLAKERPLLEERIRTELSRGPGTPATRPTGGVTPRDTAALPGTEPERRPDPVKEPGDGADPARDADPRAPAGPSALPPDAMEVKAPDEDPQGLVINNVVLAKKLVERKPDEVGTAFTLEDERVYCHIDAKNLKGPERLLTVVWHHNGKEFHRIKLRVGVGSVWRTWAYLSIKPPHVGSWRCGLFNEEGQLIRGVDFTISK